MSVGSLCRRCGRGLPADAPGGQCPACLIDPPSPVHGVDVASFSGQRRVQRWARHSQRSVTQKWRDVRGAEPVALRVEAVSWAELGRDLISILTDGFGWIRERLQSGAMPIVVGCAGWFAIFVGAIIAGEARREDEAMMGIGFGCLVAYVLWRVAYLYLAKEKITIPQRVIVIWPMAVVALLVAAFLVLWPLLAGGIFTVGTLASPERHRPEFLADASRVLMAGVAGTLIIAGMNYAILSVTGLFLPSVFEQLFKPFDVKLNSIVLLLIVFAAAALLTIGVLMAANVLHYL